MVKATHQYVISSPPAIYRLEQIYIFSKKLYTKIQKLAFILHFFEFLVHKFYIFAFWCVLRRISIISGITNMVIGG